MIIMGLLEGKDYLEKLTDSPIKGVNLKGLDTREEQSRFFQQLRAEQKGGVLVAETEEGEVVGWLSFIDKQTIQELNLPSNQHSADLKRLVGVGLFLQQNHCGKGIDTTLAQELIDLGQEWGYNGIEVICQKGESQSSDDLGSKSTPFRDAGYQEVGEYQSNHVSGCKLTILEYVWN